MAAPGRDEEVVAAVHLGHRAGDDVVAAVVAAGAGALGLTRQQGDHLARAAAAVAGAIRTCGFDDPSDASMDLALVRSGHQAIVRIDDMGLPYNGAAEDAADADVLAAAMAGGWVDGISHESRGREGNRTELVRHMDPGVDLRDRGDEPPAMADAPPIHPDTPIATRMGEAADAEAICQLTWRTYGYSYQHDEYYRPEQLAAMLDDGHQASFVAVTDDGLLVGHSAVLLADPGDVVVEGGRAMVDPRFRGHHLMGGAKQLREEWMRSHGVLAMCGEAVTAHTRSQTEKAVSSVLLAFLPPIEFRGIEGTEVPHREAVVGGITPVSAIPAQDVVAPARDAGMVAEIYRQVGLDRRVVSDDGAPSGGTHSHLDVALRGDMGHAVATIDRVGADLPGQVADRLATLERSGIDVAYADLSLAGPHTSWAADVLADAGFIFAGIMPLADRGTDVIRYQHLGDTVVDPSEIHLRNAFAGQLLEYVLAQRS